MNINFGAVRENLLALHQRELDGLSAFEAAVGRANQFGLCLDIGGPVAPVLPVPHAVIAVEASPAKLLATAAKPRAAKPAPKAAPVTVPKPAKIPGRERRAGASPIRDALAVVVGALEEPFSCADVVTAFRAKHPEHEKWSECGVSNALFHWKDAGELSGQASGGVGVPAQYRRTARWGSQRGVALSQTEERYRHMRSEMNIPTATVEP